KEAARVIKLFDPITMRVFGNSPFNKTNRTRQVVSPACPYRFWTTKAAKRTLGIRSLRVGFGARSQWLWELPRKSEPSAKAAPEPAPVPESAAGDWLEGGARLNPERPPADVPRRRWRQFVNDCHSFLSPSEDWAERAARLGWDAMALFGCAPRRPLDPGFSRSSAGEQPVMQHQPKDEDDKLMDAANGNCWGHRDATAILLAYRQDRVKDFWRD